MTVRPQDYFQTQTFSAIPTPATGDANKALAVNDAGTALVYTPLSGRKNLIINGNFDIWQRATSQTSSGYGSADRWYNSNSGTTKTASQQTFTLGQTDVLGNPKHWLRTVVTSVAGATNTCLLYQRIESVLTGAGRTVTLSFYAKADASKNIAVEFFQSFGSGGSPSALVNGIGVQKVALTTAWAKYTVTVAIPSISGKTLGTDGNDTLSVTFWFDAGSNYDARTDTLGQQSGTFDIAQVQLEIGSEATAFERRTPAEEEQLCFRYFQTLGKLVTSSLSASGYLSAGNNISHTIGLPVIMRSTPILIRIGSFGVSNVTQPVHNGLARDSVVILAAAVAAGHGYYNSVANSAYFTLDAEL